MYRTTVLLVLVVLYGRKTWSPILREERRMGVFENRVLKRLFGPKRSEIIGGW
jgi:dihydrofolate reductase